MKIGDLISANNYFLYNIYKDFSSWVLTIWLPQNGVHSIKTSVDVTIADPIQSIPAIKMVSGDVVPILDISPKQIYEIFLQQNQIVPSAKQKLTVK